MDAIINFKPKEALNINPTQDVKEKVKDSMYLETGTSQTLNVSKKTSVIMNFKTNHRNVSHLTGSNFKFLELTTVNEKQHTRTVKSQALELKFQFC